MCDNFQKDPQVYKYKWKKIAVLLLSLDVLPTSTCAVPWSSLTVVNIDTFKTC